MSKVYLSGPITGLTYNTARYGWRSTFDDELEGNHIVLSPMRHEGHLAEMRDKTIEPNNLPAGLFSHPKLIVSKDFLDIEESTIMVVNLLGASKVSQGTLVEMGYAHALGKTIVTIMDEGDKIHNSPFIPVISNVIVHSLEQAIVIVNSLLSEGV